MPYPVNTMENQHTMAARKATMLRMYSQMNCGMKISQLVRTLTGGIFAGPGRRLDGQRIGARHEGLPSFASSAGTIARPTSPMSDVSSPLFSWRMHV